MTNLTATKTTTELAPELSIKLMRAASDQFYSMAANTQCHAFLEFTGLLNEYIKICEENLARGIDFRQENVHTGNTEMTIQDYQVDYMNEKLECIFQGLIRMQKQTPIHYYIHLARNLTVHNIRLANGKKLICTDPSLSLTVRKKDGLFITEAPVIGIDCSADTGSSLIKEIHRELVILWEEYAKECTDNLTEDAKLLQQNLLSFFSEQD